MACPRRQWHRRPSCRVDAEDVAGRDEAQPALNALAADHLVVALHGADLDGHAAMISLMTLILPLVTVEAPVRFSLPTLIAYTPPVLAPDMVASICSW
ncbi:hypothetical protein PHYPSEUDO_006755 [Phytophthora pseudosyringae]|uniref:Uncharacterized protein n=1 Tax=Phytophthora pseudosyringae TaxID=221518 RepID=A0A8T1VHY3_9STRA|nr:hypothetical protein PHYPSEUDO_006755 [Phytophthora pseudosyringae]